MLKRIHDGHIQIYQSEDLKQDCRYKYVYKFFSHTSSESEKIHIYENDKFPIELVYKTRGYMFIKGKRISNKKIIDSLPMLPNFDKQFNKTMYVDLNQHFNINTIAVIQCVPYKNVSPLVLKDVMFKFDNEEVLSQLKNIDELYQKEVNDSFKKFNIKNINSWVEQIVDTCPLSSLTGMPYSYQEVITNNDFKITKNKNNTEFTICYDIRSNKEFEIIKELEQREDDNQYVIFYENYNNRLKEIKEKLKKKKLTYQPVKNISDDICIKVLWKDLKSLDISWNILDFL